MIEEILDDVLAEEVQDLVGHYLRLLDQGYCDSLPLIGLIGFVRGHFLSPAENLVAYRGERPYVILNRYPYTSGHLMVVPYHHQATLEALDPETRAEMMEFSTRCMTLLRRIYNPPAFNMGANIGEAAGAGVKAHVHIHIVPRWMGDTNFMSAVGETRVLPEALEETYQRVKNGFQNS